MHRDNSKNAAWKCYKQSHVNSQSAHNRYHCQGWNIHLITCCLKIKVCVLVEYFVLTLAGYFSEWLYVCVYDVWNVHKKPWQVWKDDTNRKIRWYKWLQGNWTFKTSKKARVSIVKEILIFHWKWIVRMRYRRKASVSCSSAGSKTYTCMHRLYWSWFWQLEEFVTLLNRFKL
jgi:hypothetical protein